jgi:hypothetical protein
MLIELLLIINIIISLLIIIFIINIKCKHLQVILYILISINVVISSLYLYNIYSGINKINGTNDIITKEIIYGENLNNLENNVENTDISIKDLLYNNIIKLDNDIKQINNKILIDKNNNIFNNQLYLQKNKLENQLKELKKEYETKYISKSIFNKLNNIFNFSKNKTQIVNDSKLYGEFKSDNDSLLYSNF